MRIGEVIGTVTLSRAHPSVAGYALRLVVPMSWEQLNSDERPSGEAIAVLDELHPGVGDRIAITEGPEATNPFQPNPKPIDAYNAAIIDTLEVEPSPSSSGK